MREAKESQRHLPLRPENVRVFTSQRKNRVVPKAQISSLIGIGKTRAIALRTCRGRTTSEGHPINGSTRQLLCALARGSRTVWVFPPSAKQLFIRGTPSECRSILKHYSTQARTSGSTWRTAPQPGDGDRGRLRFCHPRADRSRTLRAVRAGSRRTAGEPFGEVESVKAVSDLYSPVEGEVIEVNKALITPDPKDGHGEFRLSLRKDPDGTGWLVKTGSKRRPSRNCSISRPTRNNVTKRKDRRCN